MLEVHNWLLSVAVFNVMCFCNQMKFIQVILNLLHGKYLKFYTDQYHALYILPPCEKHVMRLSYSIYTTLKHMYVSTQTFGYCEVN